MVNPRYAQDVVKFYSTLEATSRKGFDAVLSNLMGTCLYQMQKVNVNFIKEAFIVEDDDMLEDLLHVIF